MKDSADSHTPRRLAKQLRDARIFMKVSQTDMAERMERTQSWVSLIERGQISLTPEIIDRWCEALHLPEKDRASLSQEHARENEKYVSWRLLWADGADRVQNERGDLEARSKHLRLFQSTFIHSLLQTPRYIECAYSASHFFADDSQLNKYLQARLARQAILHDSKKQIDALITESALRSMLAPSDVMGGQVEHLANLSERQMINVGIIPCNQRMTAVPHNSWDIFDDDVSFVELVSGQVTFREPEDLALYIDTFEMLWEESLQEDAARGFLWTLAREYEHTELRDPLSW